MNSNAVFNQVVILFFIILVGFYAKRKNIITEDVSKKLSELLLRITSPFLVISSFQFKFTHEILYNVLVIFAFAMLAHIFSIFAGKLLYSKYPDSVKKVLEFSTVYSNCGFMGFPLLESLYGKVGILYGSVYVAVFNLFLWTNGVVIFNGRQGFKTLKKAIVNPGIISVAIGILLFVFSIQLPYPVSRTLELVGSMTVPLSMLIVGSTLAEVHFKELLSGFPLYYATGVRLVLLPVLTLILLKLFHFPDTLLGTCVLLVAMPVAATTTIFAEMYGGDSPLASRIVAFSTVLSICTIPLVIALV